MPELVILSCKLARNHPTHNPRDSPLTNNGAAYTQKTHLKLIEGSENIVMLAFICIVDAACQPSLTKGGFVMFRSSFSFYFQHFYWLSCTHFSDDWIFKCFKMNCANCKYSIIFYVNTWRQTVTERCSGALRQDYTHGAD